MAGDDSDGRPIDSKVARVIEEYDLKGLGVDLEREWLGEDNESTSLRDLEARFNRRVLEAALSGAGESPLDGEVENLYRLLSDDDVTRGMQTQAEARLEAAGIDPEALQTDFVSHQAIHTYLKKYRGVERSDSRSDADRITSMRETVQRLRNRLRAVSENGLQWLIDTDRIALDGFDVIVDVQVICSSCGRQTDLGGLLDRGGCRCSTEDR